MQLPAAIKELAELLSVASAAVQNLVRAQPQAVGSPDKVAELLENVQQLSKRLCDLAEEIEERGQ